MKKRNILGLLLLAFCVVCRFHAPSADFYAEKLYPCISGVLSFVAAIFPFSLEEIAVITFFVLILFLVVKGIRRRERFFVLAGKLITLVMWLGVWFYMGWGNNYYRTGLYERNGIERAVYDEAVFRTFLSGFTAELNQAATKTGAFDKESLETDIKSYYTDVVRPFGYTGLHGWQHIKKPLFNRLYSAVSVSGFMGSFFCESQVNEDVLDLEYPFVAAHELAHLAGVASEAEANWWAFDFCRNSPESAVCYSGYLSILPYVLQNAKMLLPSDDYNLWAASVSDKVKADYTASVRHWKELRVGWIDRTQSWIYNLFLKWNGVSEGIHDYFGVVSVIMTMDAAAI